MLNWRLRFRTTAGLVHSHRRVLELVEHLLSIESLADLASLVTLLTSA
jgi:hypothetical protein